MASPVSAREVAEQLGAELVGDAGLSIDRIGPLKGATRSTISFLSNPRYAAELAESLAGCVIVSPAQREQVAGRPAALITPDPYHSFARLTQWWARRHRPAVQPGIHATALVASSAEVAPTACVGPYVVVEEGAKVGAHAVIGAHGFIGVGASVGAETKFASRVTLNAACVVGERCLLHSGVVIGADGFGFAPHEGRWEKIEQLGAVRIGNDVEIGANTCIDRGALEDTVIEDGVKLDNLVQIGHNVHIGEHTAMAGCVGVAGSARIGPRCTIGGAANILGHLSLAEGVHISAGSLVMRSIIKPGLYTGIFPIDDNASWEKNAATLRNLHSLRERLRALEKKTS